MLLESKEENNFPEVFIKIVMPVILKVNIYDNERSGAFMEQLRLNPGKLLDENGHLTEKGYATSLVKTYFRRDIKAGALRIKEWDYYLIYNNDYGVALTLADNSYMGLVSTSFLDFKNKTERTVSPMTILPMGKTSLPSSTKTGDAIFKNSKASVAFCQNGSSRKLTLEMTNFEKAEPIAIEFELFDEPKDSMVIATPFTNKPKAFYYNQKIIGMRAHGTVNYKKNTYVFTPETSGKACYPKKMCKKYPDMNHK